MKTFSYDGISVQLLGLMGIDTDNLVRATVNFEAGQVAIVQAEYYVVASVDVKGDLDPPTELKKYQIHAIEVS